MAVAELSAEAIALAACLASTMDYDGVFTLQASGDGPVKTLFADVTSAGAVRGYTSFDKNIGISDRGAPAAIISLMGTGYLAFTVDQGEQGRYQGIVPIEAADLKSVSMRYFSDSEQIDTALLIAARPGQRSMAGMRRHYCCNAFLKPVAVLKPVSVLPMMRIWISGIRPAR